MLVDDAIVLCLLLDKESLFLSTFDAIEWYSEKQAKKRHGNEKVKGRVAVSAVVGDCAERGNKGWSESDRNNRNAKEGGTSPADKGSDEGGSAADEVQQGKRLELEASRGNFGDVCLRYLQREGEEGMTPSVMSSRCTPIPSR